MQLSTAITVHVNLCIHKGMVDGSQHGTSDVYLVPSPYLLKCFR
jgi:hypothetical protein